jgi:hypothetical protein
VNLHTPRPNLAENARTEGLYYIFQSGWSGVAETMITALYSNSTASSTDMAPFKTPAMSF